MLKGLLFGPIGYREIQSTGRASRVHNPHQSRATSPAPMAASLCLRAALGIEQLCYEATRLFDAATLNKRRPV
jgi:hypothetical protein